MGYKNKTNIIKVEPGAQRLRRVAGICLFTNPAIVSPGNQTREPCRSKPQPCRDKRYGTNAKIKPSAARYGRLAH